MIDSFSQQYAFLSNFYSSPLKYQGWTYPTLEHAFQAAKTDDRTEKAQIADAVTPRQAKQLDRRVAIKPGWHQYWRYVVMEELLAIKFHPDEQLALDLMLTSSHALVEGNTWHDQTWGDCRCGEISCRESGMNLLGWMLMRQRTYVQDVLRDCAMERES